MIYKNDINISVNTYIMGIYYNDDKIYGICLYNFIDDVENRLYEKISYFTNKSSDFSGCHYLYFL